MKIRIFCLVLLTLPVSTVTSQLLSLPADVFQEDQTRNRSDQDWVLVDSVSAAVRITAGEQAVVAFDNISGSLAVFYPEAGLTPQAINAVETAPEWLQMDLADNLSRIPEYYQNLYADIILETQDPYVDEMAFQIAHIAPQTLTYYNFYPDILTYNLELLYEIDADLDYVDIVNYGSAASGGDYYSTVNYRVYEDPDTLDLEMPRDIYYWFIVHPKLHREVPDFIDPVTGSHADPPAGVFWRDYLYNHADTGYPFLKDSLIVCSTLWNCTQNSLDNGAVGALTRWVTNVMVFTPHSHHNQPVKIYNWHEGTCSVHSYLTSAASRTALVPATVAVMYRDNHKINEFWEREWVAWEPVGTHIDDPRVYDPGWNWDIATVFDWRGDGYTWNVTEKYTDVCTLTVNVEDAVGNPVDGACIILDSDGSPGPRCFVAYTSSTGFMQFLFGDERPLKARVSSEIGVYPPSGFQTITSVTGIGEHYTWNVVLDGEVPDLEISEDTMPQTPTENYRLVIEFDVPDEIVYGTNLDDYDVYSEPVYPGLVDYFIGDEADYSSYMTGEPFKGFEIAQGSSAGTTDFILPTDERYYAVFSNRSSLCVTQKVEFTAWLYEDQTGISHVEERACVFILQCNPNPFSSYTSIPVIVGGSEPADIRMNIYDVHGRLICNLLEESKYPGTYNIVWNGSDNRGISVPSGIYFCRILTEDFTESTRMVLIH